MKNRQRDDEALPLGWELASPDTVFRLGKRLRGRKSRRQFLRGAATAASLLVTGGAFGLWWAATRRREHDYGGIACEQARSLMPAMMAMKLPLAEAARVRNHLALCPRCRLFQENMKQQG